MEEKTTVVHVPADTSGHTFHSLAEAMSFLKAGQTSHAGAAQPQQQGR